MEEVCIEKADFERDISDLEKLSKLFSQQKTYLNKQISSFNQKYETYKDKLTDIELKQINIQKQIVIISFLNFHLKLNFFYFRRMNAKKQILYQLISIENIYKLILKYLHEKINKFTTNKCY